MNNHCHRIEYLKFLLNIAELRLSNEPNSNFYKHEVATIKDLIQVCEEHEKLTLENEKLKDKWQKWKRLAQEFDKFSREDNE